MKLSASLALSFALASSPLLAQSPQTPSATPQSAAQQSEVPPPDAQSTLSVRSTLVLVPTLVKQKDGKLVYTLKADDFIITDDGVEQKLRLEADTDQQPLALVICVETGASGAEHLEDYQNLGPILENFVGAVPHRIAVVAFDSKPALVQHFTTSSDQVGRIMQRLDEGDEHGAILDALNYSVSLLRKQPPTYRRAILLISETLDNRSQIDLGDALKAIGDTNTTIYSLGFSSTKAAVGKELGKISSTQPGPAHGCFSRDPEDPNVDMTVSKTTQSFDCLAMLAPPLHLVKMAAIAAMKGLRRNTPETVAKLTGGEYSSFKNTKTLEKDLMTMANHVPNRYVLSFHPQNPHTGPHVLDVKLKNYTNLVIEARSSYWIDEDGSAGK